MFTITNFILTYAQQTAGMSSIALQGPLSSDETRLINGLAAVNTAPIISSAASAPSLSSKFDYPWFFRVGYSDTQRMQVFADLMKNFGWSHAVLLTTSDFYGTSAASTLDSLLSPGALTVYTYDNTNYSYIAGNITSNNLKIILFLSSPQYYSSLLDCLTAHVGCDFAGPNITFAEGFVWIFGDSFPFYTANPAAGPISPTFCPAVNGSIVLQSYYSPAWTQAQTSDTPPPRVRYPLKQIWKDAVRVYQTTTLLGFSNGPFPVWFPDHFWTQEYVPYLIDSFYAVAYAYKSLHNNNWKALGCGLKQALLNNVSFTGYTGQVSFSSTQDRSTASFLLFTPSAASGSCADMGPTRTMASLGRWNWTAATSSSSYAITLPAAWGNVVPKDGYIVPNAQPSVSPYAGIAVALFIIAATTAPSTFALVHYRKARPIITAPAVHLILILAGTDLLLSSLIPITFVQPTLGSCVAQFVLSVVGYDLVVAALGVKVFMYELLTRRAERRVFSLLNNQKIAIYTLVAALPALIITTVVVATDPPSPQSSIDGGYVVYHCITKNYTGSAVVLVWLGLMSLFAIVLAWRNRGTTISSDSRLIVFALANALLMAIIGVTLGFVLQGSASGAAIVVFFIAIAFGTVATWGLTHGPRLFKLYTLRKSGRVWITNRSTTTKESLTPMESEPSSSYSSYVPPPQSYRGVTLADDEDTDYMSDAYPSSEEGDDHDWRNSATYEGNDAPQEPQVALDSDNDNDNASDGSSM